MDKSLEEEIFESYIVRKWMLTKAFQLSLQAGVFGIKRTLRSDYNIFMGSRMELGELPMTKEKIMSHGEMNIIGIDGIMYGKGTLSRTQCSS